MFWYHIKQWFFPFLFVAGFGTLLHFTYEASGNNAVVALFSAVNESVWEHLKLLFFPMVFYTLYQLSNKVKPAVIPGNLAATLLGMLFIIITYYTYTGLVGHNITFVDITMYYIAVVLTLWLSVKLREIYMKFRVVPAIIGTLILILLFGIFTFYPPDFGLFQPPQSVSQIK